MTRNECRTFFDKVGRNWERAWQENVTPWEIHSVNPSFVEALALLKTSHFPPGRRALVPGCGSGYDLSHLKKKVWTVMGVEVSETAAALARKRANVTVVHGDFLTLHRCTTNDDDDKTTTKSCRHRRPYYDLVYDYLFFSAMEPKMRLDVARQFHSLLQPDTGRLLTLLFPLPSSEGKAAVSGPPFALTLQDYHDIFTQANLELISTHTPQMSIKPRRGRELIAFWKRNETPSP
jgi:SAM-dependent methyltransferase